MRYLAYVATRYRAGEFYDWAIILRENQKMIGTCGFTSISEKDGAAQIGFVLNPAYHNMGYGYEAALEVMRLGFFEFGFNRIEAKCMCGNVASRALMHKLGMQYEGCARQLMFVKGVFRDIETCSILKSEFVEKHSIKRANIVKGSITSVLMGG
jgi:ribosomal-protein-alanine N-acetyltransferase